MSRDTLLTTSFKKNYKLAMKRNLDITLLDECIRKLAAREELSSKIRGHVLTGKWSGHRECHIQPDWLLTQLSTLVPKIYLNEHF